MRLRATQVEYQFGVAGVGMQWQVDLTRFMPALSRGHINSLARIGTRWTFPAALQRCTWMGRCAVKGVAWVVLTNAAGTSRCCCC